MRIAICDDEESFLSEFEVYFMRFIQEYEENIQLICFRNGEQFLEYFQKYKDIAIVFMDIRMEVLDGLNTARRLRVLDEKIKIIFLTSLEQYAVYGYKVKASDYVLKPLDYKRFRALLYTTLASIKKEDMSYFIEKNDNGIYKIYYCDIIYIETYRRNVLIHNAGEKIVSYRKMKEYESELDERFYRVHSGYIVNMAYIVSVKNLEIGLHNGESIPISKPRKRCFSKALAEYNARLL